MPTSPTRYPLQSRLSQSHTDIGVVGLGYVGLPLALSFAEHVTCIGYDNNPHRVAQLESGQTGFRHIQDVYLQTAQRKKALFVSSDVRRLSRCQSIIIAVPTPLGRHREPLMDYVKQAAHDVGSILSPGMLVVLESTTYPGTTEDLVRPILEKQSGLVAGKDFALAYSPEREDPGNQEFTTTRIPKVVAGLTPACLQRAQDMYATAFPCTVPVSNLRTAEMTKLLENIFRNVNIALVNELKMLCQSIGGIDIFEVIEAAKTKPFGFMPFYPGPGLGGHCIPIDPFYLTWFARQHNQSTRFVELAGEVNGQMPNYVCYRLSYALSKHARRAMQGARVLVLGVAYKADVEDVRESPAMDIVRNLLAQGVRVSYHDPHVHGVKLDDDSGLLSVAIDRPDQVRAYDAVLLLTAHKGVDYAMVGKHARLIVDTRNAFAQTQVHCPLFHA